jgi:hypothetical protein
MVGDLAFIKSQSKERALVTFTAKLFIVSQQSDMQCIVSQAVNSLGVKTFLTEEVIPPELSDNLCDVPMIFLIIAVTAMFLCEREKSCVWGKRTVTVKQAPRKVTVPQMRGQPCG